MQVLEQEHFTGERALYHKNNLKINLSSFSDGESPLKECRDIELDSCIFKWKYPLWYSENIKVYNTQFLETARSGIWYTHNIEIKNSVIEAPKTFRRCNGITLIDTVMPKAEETFWSCKNIKLKNVSAAGNYFLMNSENIFADNLRVNGNYAFDGAKNIEIHNSVFLTKDAFWNCENVTVYNSTLIGEYLAWNTKNLTLINCTVESNQGLCYVENLKMENCRMIDTDLCFELSTVDCDINSKIDSVKNPISGTVRAKSIGEIILDEEMIDPSKTVILETDKKIKEHR